MDADFKNKDTTECFSGMGDLCERKGKSLLAVMGWKEKRRGGGALVVFG